MSLQRVEKNLLRYSLVVSFIAISLSLISYYFIDHSLSIYFDNDDLLPYRKIAKHLTDIGLGENSFFIAIVTFIIFYFADKKVPQMKLMGDRWSWLKSWSLNYFFALIFSGLVGQVIKFSIGRQRPHVSDTFDSTVFDPMSLTSYNQSMPSGHAQVLFCSATMIAIFWPRQAWLIYTLAAILTFTRVVVHAHFLSDIMIGGLVGHLGALWCVWLLQKYYPAKYSLSSRKS